MKRFLGLIFLCGMKITYCHSKEHPKDDSVDVNNLISKILKADKFNELADRIADRAVLKLNGLQRPTFKSVVATDEDMQNSKVKHEKTSNNEELNYSFERPKGLGKHRHGKIDVDAVLKKALPLKGLKLRYKELKKKYSKAALRTPDTNIMDTDPNNIQDYHKFAEDVQMDFNQNIKTVSNEDFRNTFDSGENISSNKRLTTRVEGDKQMAFVESPDYNNYHEMRAEQSEQDTTKKLPF